MLFYLIYLYCLELSVSIISIINSSENLNCLWFLQSNTNFGPDCLDVCNHTPLFVTVHFLWDMNMCLCMEAKPQVSFSSPRKAEGETVPLLRETMTLIPVSMNGTEKSTTSDLSSLMVSEPTAMWAFFNTTWGLATERQKRNVQVSGFRELHMFKYCGGNCKNNLVLKCMNKCLRSYFCNITTVGQKLTPHHHHPPFKGGLLVYLALSCCSHE